MPRQNCTKENKRGKKKREKTETTRRDRREGGGDPPKIKQKQITKRSQNSVGQGPKDGSTTGGGGHGGGWSLSHPGKGRGEGAEGGPAHGPCESNLAGDMLHRKKSPRRRKREDLTRPRGPIKCQKNQKIPWGMGGKGGNSDTRGNTRNV